MNVGYSDRDVLLLILNLFFPPIPVFMKRGLKVVFWINLGLSILGWIPGKFSILLLYSNII
jgi:uncharacterized membrane protein YqaE (UPF0057 family)